jgi:hypothetical protein
MDLWKWGRPTLFLHRRGCCDGNARNKRLPVVEVGEACVFGFEAQSFLLVEPLAEQVQTIAGERNVVRWKREQQALRWRG